MIDPRTVNRVADEYEARIAAIQANHLAALSRARDEARRQALEEAANAVMATGRIVTDGLVRLGRMEQGYAQARSDCYDAIHSLLTPKPQGETKEQP